MKDIGSIAIVGAGAVGLYYGGRLAEAGHDVHFYSRSDAQALRRNGLTGSSFLGDFRIPADRLRAYDDVHQMPRVDWVISTLKATARPHYKSLIEPLIDDGTAIVALQNGLGNEEELSRHFGADRVLGAIAYVCIDRPRPGHANHTAQGELKVGEFRRPPSDRACSIVNAWRDAKVPASVVEDLRYDRWHKQVWNVAFNGLGAARDQNCAQLLSTSEGCDAVRSVMRDVLRAAASVGVTLDDDLIEFQITRTATVGAYKTSMHLDRLAGRPMEVDAILGEPIRQAAAAGVTDLPALTELHATLIELDAPIRDRALSGASGTARP